MEAVWFLLIGVVVGQGLQFVRELLIERRREAQAIKAEQVKAEREAQAYVRTTRQARRLVADELDTMANHLAMLGRQNTLLRASYSRSPSPRCRGGAVFRASPQRFLTWA